MPNPSFIATGSRPIIPLGPWMEYKDHLLTSDQIFELETLPKSVAVIGLGVIGQWPPVRGRGD